MCGIIAVVRRPGAGAPAAAAEVARARSTPAPAVAGRAPAPTWRRRSTAAAGRVEAVDRLLRGIAGRARAARRDRDLRRRASTPRVDALDDRDRRDRGATSTTPASPARRRSRRVNAALVRLKDARLGRRSATGCARRARSPTSPGPIAGRPAIEAFTSVQLALSALDRLEVRGRDSAGLHAARARPRPRPRRRRPSRALLADRARRPAVRVAGRCARPRATSASSTRRRPRSASWATTPRRCAPPSAATTLLRRALAADGAEALVLGHTRWASVGIISAGQRPPAQLARRSAGDDGPYVTAALNGDVDNFADLKATDGLRIAGRDHHRRQGDPHARVAPARRRRRRSVEAFRRTVAALRRARSPSPPAPRPRPTGCCSRCGAAARRSTSASPRTPTSWPASPTALVEETATYLRMDGETPADPEQPDRQPGPDRRARRRPAPARSRASAASPTTARELPVARRRARSTPRSPPATSTAATTRTSCSRRSREAPASFRKTLRGKLVERDGGCSASRSAPETLPDDAARPAARRRASTGSSVIGQGTAAVAGQSLAARARAALAPARRLRVEAAAGHRAVGLRPARRHERHAGRRHQPVAAPPPTPTAPSTSSAARGARGDRHRQPAQQRPHRQVRRRALHVRRARRGDERRVDQGVLRADRGRLPARARASPTSVGAPATRRRPRRCSPALRDAARRDGRSRSTAGRRSPSAAQRLAPSARYWAVVGNGANRIAADEVRIKLSELCYKSIACDATEDKKHIDLSSEPLILVCAAGLDGLERRRRGQGGRDLPGPQGGADRDRHRGRGALRRRARR